MSKQTVIRNVSFAVAIVSVVGLGLLGGTVAIAAIQPALAPVGLTSDKGVETTPAPAPVYPKNESGLTYGSAAQAISPDTEPDLVLVVATNGEQGYVYKKDLDMANGTTAAKNFRSPEDALRWQESESHSDQIVEVYALDGVARIGEFLVVGTDTQQLVGKR